MSLEQAITDHAAAIRELAAANLEVAAIMTATIKSQLAQAAISAPIGHAQGDDHMLTAAALRDKKAADLEKSVAKVEAAAKNEGKSAAGTATPAADTQNTAGAADTATAEAQTSYDYAKDVQPLLVKVGKNRDQLVALLKSFGAAKGADIKPADYAAVIAKANELIAG